MSSKSKKNKRQLVRLQSTESHYYMVKKGNGPGEEKLSFRKYDPVVRAHVLFKEKKLS